MLRFGLYFGAKLFAKASVGLLDIIIDVDQKLIRLPHNKNELEKMLIREKRIDIFNKCLNFLDTRVALDQNGFKFDIFEH